MEKNVTSDIVDEEGLGSDQECRRDILDKLC